MFIDAITELFFLYIISANLLNPEGFSLGVCRGHLAVHLPIIDLWKFGVEAGGYPSRLILISN